MVSRQNDSRTVIRTCNKGVRKLRVPGHYLHHPTFSCFDTILECDRHTDRHMMMAYTALA